MVFQSNITHLVDSQGSNEERQLIARWRTEVDGFLGTFGSDLLAGNCLLAFEFSANLELGLAVRPATVPCPVIALRARRLLQEPLRTVAEQAAAASVDCQVSLHVSPAACRYTLHLDNQAGRTGLPLQQHYGYTPPPLAPAAIHSWLLGDDISFWLTSKRTPRLEGRLKEATAQLENRFRVSLGTHPVEMLEQYTWTGRQEWSLMRSGLALHSIPADLAARLLSGSGLTHFRYLAPYRPYRLLAVTFDRSEQIEKYILLP